MKDYSVLMVSGYIGSEEEAIMLRRQWLNLYDLYRTFGLNFSVAPRRDDQDGVSRRSMWDYAKTLQNYFIGKANDRIALIAFSAGGPISMMALQRFMTRRDLGPKIVSMFNIETTNRGIPRSMGREMGFPDTEFIQDLEPDSHFMRRLLRYSPVGIKRTNVCGSYSQARPDVFGPENGYETISMPGIQHGMLEFSRFVHLAIIARLLDP